MCWLLIMGTPENMVSWKRLWVERGLWCHLFSVTARTAGFKVLGKDPSRRERVWF